MGEVPRQIQPDYRMSLAAERTYLAYIRTSLALLAAGVAVVGALTDVGQLALRRAIGILLVTAGLVVGVTARPRWRAVDAAMRRGAELPPARPIVAVSWVVVAGGLLAMVFVIAV